MTAERDRLADSTADWHRWGPYLSDRQWGTVREDYSADGNPWNYFPFEHARSRAYRWGEDGLGGLSDAQGLLCLAVALWNGNDPILKERLFGLGNEEGNHGEDVKEEYFYRDATPTHSYLRMLYRYPQAEFPYQRLRDESRRRGRGQPEFEIRDSGVFDGGRYFDIEIEYAKAGPDDVLMRVTAHNRGPEAADLHVIPHVWFRNTWSWGADGVRPMLRRVDDGTIEADSPPLGHYLVSADGNPALLFCENETNGERVFGQPSAMPFPKDAFHDRVIRGRVEAVNPLAVGTKAGVWYRFSVPAGGRVSVRLRLASVAAPDPPEEFETTFSRRQREADEFYADLSGRVTDPVARAVQRQAWAGLVWSKQLYTYDVALWLTGDPGQPAPPAGHQRVRNFDWDHLRAGDIIAMPDQW